MSIEWLVSSTNVCVQEGELHTGGGCEGSACCWAKFPRCHRNSLAVVYFMHLSVFMIKERCLQSCGPLSSFFTRHWMVSDVPVSWQILLDFRFCVLHVISVQRISRNMWGAALQRTLLCNGLTGTNDCRQKVDSKYVDNFPNVRIVISTINIITLTSPGVTLAMCPPFSPKTLVCCYRNKMKSAGPMATVFLWLQTQRDSTAPRVHKFPFKHHFYVVK